MKVKFGRVERTLDLKGSCRNNCKWRPPALPARRDAASVQLLEAIRGLPNADQQLMLGAFDVGCNRASMALGFKFENWQLLPWQLAGQCGCSLRSLFMTEPGYTHLSFRGSLRVPNGCGVGWRFQIRCASHRARVAWLLSSSEELTHRRICRRSGLQGVCGFQGYVCRG